MPSIVASKTFQYSESKNKAAEASFKNPYLSMKTSMRKKGKEEDLDQN
jgi:hypothetical protein